MLVKFRAECQRDVNELLEIIPRNCLLWYKIIRIPFPNKSDIFLPDLECEFEINNLSIPDIVDLMSHISDSHVMQQTIALAENYTGERDYQDYDNHKQRHLLLHQHLDELAADYLGQTDKRLVDTTVLEFIKWSYQQTLEPTQKQ